jgi:hypothetical protein
VSFAAYLIGILSQFLNFPFVRIGTFIAYIPSVFRGITGEFKLEIRLPLLASAGIYIDRPPVFPLESAEDKGAYKDFRNQRKLALSSGKFSGKGVASLVSFVTERAQATNSYKDSSSKYRILTYLSREVPNQGNALVGREPELYSVYDRLISEYEFRIGISLPLASLATTLAFR